jgi:hypothetical protein
MQETGRLHFLADFETFVLKRGSAPPDKKTAGLNAGASVKTTTLHHPTR